MNSLTHLVSPVLIRRFNTCREWFFIQDGRKVNLGLNNSLTVQALCHCYPAAIHRFRSSVVRHQG
jgi:hypothetical protein